MKITCKTTTMRLIHSKSQHSYPHTNTTKASLFRFQFVYSKYLKMLMWYNSTATTTHNIILFSLHHAIMPNTNTFIFSKMCLNTDNNNKTKTINEAKRVCLQYICKKNVFSLPSTCVPTTQLQLPR